jgi:hypothetical protein
MRYWEKILTEIESEFIWEKISMSQTSSPKNPGPDNILREIFDDPGLMI